MEFGFDLAEVLDAARSTVESLLPSLTPAIAVLLGLAVAGGVLGLLRRALLFSRSRL